MGGHVVVLPNDCDSILVLNASTGALEKQIAKSAVGDVTQLLSVTGDHLLIAGETRVTFLNFVWWKGSTGSAANPGYWRNDFAPILGRCAMSKVPIIAARGALYALNLKIGKVLWRQAYADPSDAGNITASNGYLIVAGPTHVTVYPPNLDDCGSTPADR